MSNILELNCWVLGDDPRRVFSVKIATSETISYLKKGIKDEIKHSFDDRYHKRVDTFLRYGWIVEQYLKAGSMWCRQAGVRRRLSFAFSQLRAL
jgi:hypothetical protein